MKKVIIAIVIAVAAVLAFWLVKCKQTAYNEAKINSSIEEKFNLMDKNGDGLIDREEFDASAAKIIEGKQINTPEKLERFNETKNRTWDNTDTNKDSLITMNEFKEMAYRFHQRRTLASNK